jgi:hypothetical protein
MLNPNLKWCCHCQKRDHDDSECWATRMVPSLKHDPVTDAIRLVAEKYSKDRAISGGVNGGGSSC